MKYCGVSRISPFRLPTPSHTLEEGRTLEETPLELGVSSWWHGFSRNAAWFITTCYHMLAHVITVVCKLGLRDRDMNTVCSLAWMNIRNILKKLLKLLYNKPVISWTKLFTMKLINQKSIFPSQNIIIQWPNYQEFNYLNDRPYTLITFLA